jgi:THO complex subunit 7
MSESEHALQREQIAALKVALEEAQLVRRRKMEYDQVAEKVNTLPTRTELEEWVHSVDSITFLTNTM